MILTRFELSFDGQPQGVGMFQGLPDVGLTVPQYSKALSLFEDLPSPYIDLRDCNFETVSFWFTPNGLITFSPKIKRLREAITPHSWDLIKAEIDDQYVDPVYKDRYQMAVPVEQAKNLMPKFKEF